MHAALLKAVELFNNGRFDEFQDALDAMTSSTRASSERQFYTLLKNIAEALLQLSDGDEQDAEGMLGSACDWTFMPLPAGSAWPRCARTCSGCWASCAVAGGQTRGASAVAPSPPARPAG